MEMIIALGLLAAILLTVPPTLAAIGRVERHQRRTQFALQEVHSIQQRILSVAAEGPVDDAAIEPLLVLSDGAADTLGTTSVTAERSAIDGSEWTRLTVVLRWGVDLRNRTTLAILLAPAPSVRQNETEAQ